MNGWLGTWEETLFIGVPQRFETLLRIAAPRLTIVRLELISKLLLREHHPFFGSTDALTIQLALMSKSPTKRYLLSCDS